MACYSCINYEQLRRALELLGIIPKDSSGNDLSGYIKNLDTSLSTLDSDIKADQPRHITNAYDSANDRFKISIENDSTGILKKGDLAFDSNGNLKVDIAADDVGLLRLGDLLPSKVADNLASLDNSSGSSTAAMAVFSSDVSISGGGVLTIQVALDTEAPVKLKITRGGNTLEYYLNTGNSLAANAWYEFSITVLDGDTVNVLVDVPAGSTINAYAALILRKR